MNINVNILLVRSGPAARMPVVSAAGGGDIQKGQPIQRFLQTNKGHHNQDINRRLEMTERVAGAFFQAN